MTTMRAGSTRRRLLLDAGHHAGIALLAPVGRRPIDEYDEAIAKADQEIDVREQPEQPRGQSAELDFPERRDKVHDGRVASDRRERSVVPVTEGQRGFARAPAHEVRGGMT